MQLSYLITIVPRSACEDFTAFFKKKGVPLTLRMLGVGTARDNIRRLLGLAETEKEVFMCAIPDAKAQELMRDLVLEMDMDVVGRGITYTIPISSIVGATTLQYLGGLNSPAKEETKMNEKKQSYELIVIITNKVYVETVMDAAYAAGAGGGTVVHAHGAGSENAEKFFGVSLAPEKEMIFIVLKDNIRDAVMKSVNAAAGMQTPAKSLIFSVPITDVAGLREAYREQLEAK